MSEGFDNYPPGVREADIERHYGESHEQEPVERESWITRVATQATMQCKMATLEGAHTVEITQDNAAQELQDYLDDAIAGIDLGRSEELISLMGACLRVLDMMEDM